MHVMHESGYNYEEDKGKDNNSKYFFYQITVHQSEMSRCLKMKG